MFWCWSYISLGGSTSEEPASLREMLLPELLLSTSIISLVIFLWTFLHQWKSEDEDCIPQRSSVVSVAGPSLQDLKRPTPSSGRLVAGVGARGEAPEPACLPCHQEQGESTSSTSSVAGDSATGTESSPLSSTPGTPRATQLSRRQRKNRKREKEKEEKQIQPQVTLGKKKSAGSPPLSRKNSGEKLSPSGEMKNKKRGSVPCKQYEKLAGEDHKIFVHFTSYLLSSDQMRQMGFPQDSSLYPGKAYIYRDPDFCHIFPGVEGDGELDDGDYCKLDVNAKPFIPSLSSSESLGNVKSPSGDLSELHQREDYFSDSEGSADSSEKPVVGQKRKINIEEISGIPLNITAKEFVPGSPHTLPGSPGDPAMASESVSADSRLVEGRPEPVVPVERRCVRCSKSFLPSSPSEGPCSYHWGKPRQGEGPLFTCCAATRGSRGARGCSSSPYHVWTGLPHQAGMIGPLDGYVKTKHRKSYPANGNFGVYGLDCEMCYTLHGLELTKVTVVGIDGRLVYETLVLPEADILDHNTRFSGVTAKDLEKGPTKNLKEVQNDLMGFINADTVLVGHSLENDLRALKMIHGVVLDTSTVFPHFYGLPFRRSLSSLVRSYLKREIQVNSWGHDSYEDARACVELMLWKTRKDLQARSH